MPNSKRNYSTIDVTKFIMAIVVIAIHTHPLENCENLLVKRIYDNTVCYAVPFFFLASGYLLAIKCNSLDVEEELRIVRRYLLKIIKMYILWSTIYLPLAIYYYVKEEKTVLKSILEYIRGLLFVGEHYNSWMLWYLLATVYALVFIYFLKKKGLNQKTITAIGFFVFLVSVGIDQMIVYADGERGIVQIFVKLVQYSIGNGRILKGLLYISLGMLLKDIHFGNKVNICILSFGYVGNVFLDGTMGELFLIIGAVGMFNIVTAFELKAPEKYIILRKMSTTIYFIHLYVWTFYYKVIYGNKTFGLDSFFVTTLLSIGMAYFFNKIFICESA